MPRYSLIAVRDGDLFSEAGEWPDEQVAECWAAGLLALHFGLDADQFDTMDELIAETDGYELSVLAADPIAEAAKELLRKLVPVFEELSGEDVSCSKLPAAAVATQQLVQVLRQEGHHR